MLIAAEKKLVANFAGDPPRIAGFAWPVIQSLPVPAARRPLLSRGSHNPALHQPLFRGNRFFVQDQLASGSGRGPFSVQLAVPAV